MYNPDEIIRTNRQAFRLFEAVWKKGIEPCSNGSEKLYAAKIEAAGQRGNQKSASLWREAQHLELRSFENIGAVIELDGERFHARYEVDFEVDGYSRSIRRAKIGTFT